MKMTNEQIKEICKATAVRGIDVSKYQGTIDWAKVKASGVRFAILRAGYGRYASQKDPTFEQNYAACKRVGLPVGVYWYVYASTLEGIRREVQTLLEVIRGKQFEYPIYLDIEDKAQAGMSRAALTQMIETGCAALEQAGFFAGVYTYTSFAARMDYNALAGKYTPCGWRITDPIIIRPCPGISTSIQVPAACPAFPAGWTAIIVSEIFRRSFGRRGKMVLIRRRM